MKILISLLLFLGSHVQVQAQDVDYASPEFAACVKMSSISLRGSEATSLCENYSESGLIHVIADEKYKVCYSSVSMSLRSHEAVDTCVSYGRSKIFDMFATESYRRCFAKSADSLRAHEATNNCADYYKADLLDNFTDDNFLKCLNYRTGVRAHEAVDACMNQYKSSGARKGQVSLTLEQVNSNIQVPENTQIILKTAIEMPGKQSCVAAKDGARDVKCWVCRAKESRNDVLYRLEKDAATGLSQKILPVSEAKLSTDGKEIHFPLVHDSSDTDNLSVILCSSKKVFQIKSRAELLPILESNDLKLIIPAPKEK